MGIRQLDNPRTLDQKEFISKSTELIEDVMALNNKLQQTLQAQECQLKQLIDETHTAYESRYLVLQETIKGLHQSLTAKASANEILSLTK